MTDVTTTADSGAGAVAPAEAPKNDTQAAALETQQAPETAPQPDDAAKAEEAKKAEEGKRQNRTKAYIDRINAENRQMRERLAALESQQATPQRQAAPNTAKPPQLEDFDYDMAAWQEASVEYAAQQATRRITEQQQQSEAQRRQQETLTSYAQRADEFAADHEDFDEVVGSIQYPLHPQLQLAIQSHPRGPELAYHLGLHDDDAFALASIQPHLAAAAVERLAARLGAAPAATQPTAPAVTPPAAPARPVSQTPPPPPTVGGRAPTETPAEKLTDDEWYRRERERQRKR